MSQKLVSLCMIVRDEEPFVGRCLDSAAPFVDEMVVVDTGSRDATAARAEAAGATVLRTAWNEDFGEARNVSLQAATGRFILVLDADEWIEGGPHPAALKALVRETREEAFSVAIADRLDGGGSRHYELVRLFRNRPEHRYAGAFHEQITPSIAGRLRSRDLCVSPSGLEVGHDGYLLAHRQGRRKAERNLRLLRLRVQQAGHDAAARYFLARERVPLRNGRAIPAASLREAMEHLEWLAENPGLLAPALDADAARLHAASLLALRRPEEALRLLETRGDRGIACELLRADAEMALAGQDADSASRALERLRACFDRETRDAGPVSEPALAGPVARAHAAEAELLLGRHGEARTLTVEAAGQPGGGAAPWNARAEIEKRQGLALEALRSYVEGLRADPVDPWAWAGLGEIVLDGGDPAQAEEPLRNAALLAPGWERAEEALVTALLLQGRESETLAFFGRSPEAPGPAAQAGLLLAASAAGQAPPLRQVDPGTAGSIQRILERVAAAGRPDLLNRLAQGLRAVV